MKIKLTPRPAALFLLLLTVLFNAANVFAQAPTTEPEMADGLRASGKIYVVVAVVVVIVAGLLAYLVSLDRKVSRLEEQIKK